MPCHNFCYQYVAAASAPGYLVSTRRQNSSTDGIHWTDSKSVPCQAKPSRDTRVVYEAPAAQPYDGPLLTQRQDGAQRTRPLHRCT